MRSGFSGDARIIEHRPYAGLGATQVDGLEGRHHFCFARYQDPERMHWGPLRIWNEYVLAPGAVRPPTPHAHFDILTLVHSGTLRRTGGHEDRRPLGPGDVHLAATGHGLDLGVAAAGKAPAIYSEIWFSAEGAAAPPRQQRCALPMPATGGLERIASGYAGDDAPLRLTIPARLSQGRLSVNAGLRLSLAADARAYVKVLTGRIALGDCLAQAGDAIAIAEIDAAQIVARDDCTLLIAEMG